MHWEDETGNHHFEGKRHLPGTPEVLEVYTFQRKNFEAHSLKHRIADKVSLSRIDEAIFDPHVITSGHKPKSKRNFYRVLSYRDHKDGGRSLTVWRVHCLKARGENRYYIISTAFECITTPLHAVHNLEKEIWKTPNSLI